MNAIAPGALPANDTSVSLLQLSDEISRIAATLSRLSLGPQASNEVTTPRSAGPVVLLGSVRNALKARRLRERYFDADLFADPAWDILLELLQAELAHYRVSVSSLCIAANVPATTALRWIATLTDAGLLRRTQDPDDGRRMFMELTPKASEAMYDYFAGLEGLRVA